jgi:predicted phage tail protein
MLRNVYLEGEMGELFTPHMKLKFSRPQDAIKAIDANFPTFRSYLIEKANDGTNFHIDVAGNNLEQPEELLLIMQEGDVTITPVPAGAKSGAAKLFAAMVLIVITAGAAAAAGGVTVGAAGTTGAVATGTTVATAGGTAVVAGGGAIGAGTVASGFSAAFGGGGAFGAALNYAGGTFFGKLAIGVATNLAIAGIQQIMAPDPSSDGDQTESYLYNGGEQNIVSGDPVPVLYGRLRVPGQPISFEITGNRSVNVSKTDGNGNTEGGGQDDDGDDGPGNCLVAGTMIATGNGVVPVEKLAVGDYVTSADGGKNKIVSIMYAEDQEVLTINKGLISVTAGHPLQTVEGWAAEDVALALRSQEPGISILQLSEGMELVTTKGLERVTSIEFEEELAKVYTIRLDGDRTYIANGVITHNK